MGALFCNLVRLSLVDGFLVCSCRWRRERRVRTGGRKRLLTELPRIVNPLYGYRRFFDVRGSG